MAVVEFQRWGQHNREYGTLKRKALTIAKPLVIAGLTLAGVAVVAALVHNDAGKIDNET
jgi:hypothetical protein